MTRSVEGSKWTFLVLGGFLLFFAGAVPSLVTEASAQTGTERVKDCLEDAADSFVDCVEDSGGGLSGLVEKGLCVLKYGADGVLCILAVIK